MRLFVDGDAFPNVLKEVLFKAVQRLQVPLIMVANKYIRVPNNELFSNVVVPGGPDVADDRIVELMVAGDLVITADIPLADRVVTKNGYAINPRGELYTEANIKNRLAMRNLLDDLRNEGTVSGGPASFSKKDIQAFTNQLDRFLTKHCSKRNLS
jgi:uncharacterized protein YaiI (UPF0178 family)